MSSILTEVLTAHRSGFNAVVPFNPQTERIAALDLSSSNTALGEETYSDTALFSAYIEGKRAEDRAKYLIGGYGELREMYKRSRLFSFEQNIEQEAITRTEPRRLHLGIDIWGEAGTPVSAPYGGMIDSLAYNDNFGDYGATIILQHQIDMVVFYTLYGHLAYKDLGGLRQGQFITRGQQFAHFGPPAENGQWPPHLHFQVIEDIGENEGDYPGVCKYSEKEQYLANCPDADLVLNMNRFLPAAAVY
jgi:peptidoglycan LD-endopeptidase LytH